MNESIEPPVTKHSVIKRWFLGGILFWVPLLVCIWVLTIIVTALDKVTYLLPHTYQPKELFGYDVPGVGVVLTIVILFITGFFVSNFIGDYFLNLWEKVLNRIPLVRSIYTSVKQIIETFTSPAGTAFKKVLLIEFPKEGVWSLAFQTTKSEEAINKSLQEETINVFVPTTPNITSGFLMIMPIDKTRAVDISVEEALKMIVSLGMVQKKEESFKNDHQSV